MGTSDKPLVDRVRAVLAAAANFMTADELARAVFGRAGERNRAAVYLAIHRMEGVETRAKAYRLKKGR